MAETASDETTTAATPWATPREPIPDLVYGTETDTARHKIISADNVLFYFTDDDLMQRNKNGIWLDDIDIELAAILRVLLEVLRGGSLIDKRVKGHPLKPRFEHVLCALHLAQKFDFEEPYAELSRAIVTYIRRTQLPDVMLNTTFFNAAEYDDVELAAAAYAALIRTFTKLPPEVLSKAPPAYIYAVQQIARRVQRTKLHRVLIDFEHEAVVRNFKHYMEEHARKLNTDSSDGTVVWH